VCSSDLVLSSNNSITFAIFSLFFISLGNSLGFIGSPYLIKDLCLNVKIDFTFLGPSNAAGIIGLLLKTAIVAAPLFSGASPASALCPDGNIPTLFPWFNSFTGVFKVLGPGFSLSTGKAFNEWKNLSDQSLENNSFLAI